MEKELVDYFDKKKKIMQLTYWIARRYDIEKHLA
jgi:hypothetical protein